MDRLKLLLECMKWWAGKVAEAQDPEDVDWLLDQVRHKKYEIKEEEIARRVREKTAAPSGITAPAPAPSSFAAAGASAAVPNMEIKDGEF